MKDKKRIFRLTHLSLPCIIRMLAMNLWVIVAAAMVFVLGLNLFLSWFHVPMYQASMTYAVNSKTTSYTSFEFLLVTLRNTNYHIVDKCAVQTVECMSLLLVIKHFIFILFQHYLAILNFYNDSWIYEL